MSQTNTNTNNGQNRNENSERGGRGQGGPSGRGPGDRRNNCGNKTIAKYAFEEKMKDGPISKLSITETGHRRTQVKKITVVAHRTYHTFSYRIFQHNQYIIRICKR